ncbi:protein phosphatase [Prochlorococcus sp. MIT 1307]|uniref:protein phosphatase n=1 Tax=Prochlorococcus sp. MIT 1307 TaxID=3096219 RepID=UPI002A75769B|nr:protein phosphatase [Prochlorococcus sp. MIT 1307]
MEKSQQADIQAKLFDFALDELVLQQRDSFKPLWTLDSWVKFLIWMTLNVGLSGERGSIEQFVEALGSPLTARMRRIFFERVAYNFSLKVMADPSESRVLVMPINSCSITLEQAEQLLDQLGLIERVELDQTCWEELDAVIAIPWKSIETDD